MNDAKHILCLPGKPRKDYGLGFFVEHTTRRSFYTYQLGRAAWALLPIALGAYALALLVTAYLLVTDGCVR